MMRRMKRRSMRMKRSMMMRMRRLYDKITCKVLNGIEGDEAY